MVFFSGREAASARKELHNNTLAVLGNNMMSYILFPAFSKTARFDCELCASSSTTDALSHFRLVRPSGIQL